MPQEQRESKSAGPSPRRRFWTGVLVGIGITYGLLVVLGAAMYLLMERCPACGQVLEAPLPAPRAPQ
jgi:hypothetical protein